MTIERMSPRVHHVVPAILAIALFLIAGRVDAKGQQHLVGSWFGTAVATTVPLPPLRDFITFTSDGTAIESHRQYLADTPWGPLLVMPGHGAWERTGDHEFAVTLMLMYQGAPNHPTAPGTVLAIETIRMRLTVDRQGDRLSGTLLDEIRDLDGAVLFLGPGTYEAVRIRVVPLP
jgi:hypothetical protein